MKKIQKAFIFSFLVMTGSIANANYVTDALIKENKGLLPVTELIVNYFENQPKPRVGIENVVLLNKEEEFAKNTTPEELSKYISEISKIVFKNLNELNESNSVVVELKMLNNENLVSVASKEPMNSHDKKLLQNIFEETNKIAAIDTDEELKVQINYVVNTELPKMKIVE